MSVLSYKELMAELNHLLRSPLWTTRVAARSILGVGTSEPPDSVGPGVMPQRGISTSPVAHHQFQRRRIQEDTDHLHLPTSPWEVAASPSSCPGFSSLGLLPLRPPPSSLTWSPPSARLSSGGLRYPRLHHSRPWSRHWSQTAALIYVTLYVRSLLLHQLRMSFPILIINSMLST